MKINKYLLTEYPWLNIVPPVPVLIKRGFFSADFWINILLCILGFFPGLLHCYYIILIYPYSATYAAIGGDGHDNRTNDYGATTSWLYHHVTWCSHGELKKYLNEESEEMKFFFFHFLLFTFFFFNFIFSTTTFYLYIYQYTYIHIYIYNSIVLISSLSFLFPRYVFKTHKLKLPDTRWINLINNLLLSHRCNVSICGNQQLIHNGWVS